MAVSLGCDVEGSVLPHVDTSHTETVVQGARKRVVGKLPRVNKEKIANLKKFVGNWLSKNLTPLEPGVDCSVESWLKNSNYPEWRKLELRDAPDMRYAEDNKRYFKCASFGKDEFYTEYKHLRTINSRSDAFKKFSGPIFALIEREVFKLPYFIKKVAYPDRASFIMEKVFGGEDLPVFATDYSSFESSFTAEIMDAVELQLYEYMTQHLPDGKAWAAEIRRALTGEQFLGFKNVLVQTIATRMSGDMCTSLGNGFTNLMLMLFVGECQNLGELLGVFEGDDGLGRFERGLPDPSFFDDLPFTLKFEVHSKLSTASFCGLVFDPQVKVNCCDPRAAIAKFGWTSAKYARAKSSTLRALLRSKALSMAYQFPACPVLTALADYGLRVTRSVSVEKILNSRNTSWWVRENLSEALAAGVPERQEPAMATREVVSEKFGVSVDQQLRWEKYLDSLNTIQPLEIDLEIPLWAENATKFVRTLGVPVLDRYPILPFG